MKKLILLPLFLLLFSCEDAKVKAAKEKQADANCQLEHLQQHLALTNIMPMAIDLGLEKEYFEAIHTDTYLHLNCKQADEKWNNFMKLHDSLYKIKYEK